MVADTVWLLIGLAQAAAVPPAIGDAAPPPGSTASRADENAVRQAGDAFGTSIGRESIGLYDEDNVRGFSPIVAGNVRIDGLYFDPVIVPSSRLARSTTIRVGLGALGSPFPAPTGIVDYGFRRPGDTAAASLQVGADSWGSIDAEFDGVVPLSPSLSLGIGASALAESDLDGTLDQEAGGALILRWQAADDLELVPFINYNRTLRDDHRVTYVMADETLPPRLPRRVRFGPDWVRGTSTEINTGLLADWQLAPAWLLRGGVFRSSRTISGNFANLVRDLGANGIGRHLISADPPLAFASTSGELRLTRQMSDGVRQHQFHAALRGRASNRRFGGDTTIDLGPVRFDVPQQSPRPAFLFDPQQRDKVQQLTGGLAYEGRWTGVGELALGVQLSDYRKRIDLPAGGIQATDARPLLYNASIATNLTRNLVVYGGFVTGLEESGIAPGNAANRNEALPAIKTRQFDAGVRLELANDITLVAGVFDISKPYYNLDANNRFDALGDVINRGIELSAAGPLTNTLSIVAGAVLLWPKVTGEAVASGRIGSRPVGAISQRVELSADWRPPFWPGVSLDATLAHRSAETATVSNLVAVPARQQVDLGGRYRFRLAGQQAVLRVQVGNLFDVQGFELDGAGAYRALAGRIAEAYVTLDF